MNPSGKSSLWSVSSLSSKAACIWIHLSKKKTATDVALTVTAFWCHPFSRPLLVFISLSSSEFQNCFYALKQLRSKNNPIVKPSRLDIWKDFQIAQERSPEEGSGLG